MDEWKWHLARRMLAAYDKAAKGATGTYEQRRTFRMVAAMEEVFKFAMEKKP